MSRNWLTQEVVEKYKPIWALDHAAALMEWDIETYMPVGGAKPRGFAQAQLTLMKQERTMNLSSLVTKAEKQSDLTDYDKGVLRVVKRDLDYFTRVPPSLLEDLQRTTTEGTVVWREARKKSDFGKFKPYLEKMFELKRQEAEKLGYEGHRYDALLDRFEEGLTTKDVDRVFSSLVPNLKRILKKVLEGGKFPSSHPLEAIAYDEAAMKRVNEEALRILKMPERTFRMDVSTHPFTTGMATEDVRITTRYERKSFKDTLFSAIHESGHAIYELQVDPSLDYTPLGHTISLGVHESQSRFWENFVGRSREFTRLIYPALTKNLPFVARHSEDDVYSYFNMVRPSLIRVDADELTYNFHIVLRYELEKKLIGGEVRVDEAPALWKDMMEEFVGIRPQNDGVGVLQDVHWSGGLIGYFPTYSLGNVIGGMIYNRIQKDIDVRKTIEAGELTQLKAWLREHIHKLGATYSPKELQMRELGETYNPDHLVHYLEGKYLQ
jgi:carboxypeptidase Taq